MISFYISLEEQEHHGSRSRIYSFFTTQSRTFDEESSIFPNNFDSYLLHRFLLDFSFYCLNVFLHGNTWLFFIIFTSVSVFSHFRGKTFFPTNLSPLKDYCIRVHEYKISRAWMHFFLSYFVSFLLTDEFHKALLAKEYLINSTWNIKTHGQRSIRVVTALNFGARWWRNYLEKVKTKNNVPLESHRRSDWGMSWNDAKVVQDGSSWGLMKKSIQSIIKSQKEHIL